jgi:hypothetical protein
MSSLFLPLFVVCCSLPLAVLSQSCTGSTVFCSLIFESNSPLCAAAGCSQPAPLFSCQGPASKTCADLTRQDVCEAVRCAWSGTTSTAAAPALTPAPVAAPTPTTNKQVTTTRTRTLALDTTTTTDSSYDAATTDTLGEWLGPVIWLSTCCAVFWCQMICRRRSSASRSVSSNPLYVNQLQYSPTANQTQDAWLVTPPVVAPSDDADLQLLSDLHVGVLEAPDTAFTDDLHDDAALATFSGKIADKSPPAALATASPMVVPAFLAQWASQRSSPLLTNGVAFSAGVSDSGSFARVQAQLLQQPVLTRRLIKLLFQTLHEVQVRSSGKVPVSELARVVGLALTKMPTSGSLVAQTVCEVLITRADDIDDGGGKSDFWKRPELPGAAALEAGVVGAGDTSNATAPADQSTTQGDEATSEYDSSEEERRRREQATD